MKRVMICGAEPCGRIFVDGELFCTLAPAPGETLTAAGVSERARRDMARLNVIADALEAHVGKEQASGLSR